MPPPRLLIASIGNPAPYTNTLHSAGHSLLRQIHQTISTPTWTSMPQLPHGLTSPGPRWTLFQSLSLMNNSGPVVARAFRAWVKGLPADERASARLVVVHDELEMELGKVRVRVGGSAKGHNGLKSCVAALGAAGFARLGVGIGRPGSREKDAVTQFVLRKMTAAEKDGIRGAADEAVALLEGLGDG